LLVRQFVLRFAGIDHAEQFVGFETLRNFLQQILQLCRSLREMARVVLRYRGLELAVQFLITTRCGGMILSE